MRYRRHYTRRNPDGSRTVVSVGPIAMWYVVAGKFALVAIVLGWPFAVPILWLKVVLAIIWYPLLVTALVAYSRQRSIQ